MCPQKEFVKFVFLNRTMKINLDTIKLQSY